MARRPITQQVYEVLLASFREHPDCAAKAGRAAGVDPRTAQRGWDLGWPRQDMKPIRLLIVEEQQAARAAVQVEVAARRAMLEREREDARNNAVEARKQEGQLVLLSRTSSVRAQGIMSNLLAGAVPLAERLRDFLRAEAAKPDQVPDPLSPGRTVPNPDKVGVLVSIGLLERVVGIAQKVTSFSRESLVMERMHLGDPAQVLGLAAQPGEGSDVTLEEAALRVAAAQQALDEARQVGPFKVLDGGSAERPVTAIAPMGGDGAA